MARGHERLGSQVLPRDLEDIGLESTPQYDLYEDETQNDETSPQLTEELEPKPEVDDKYRVAEIMLPRGDKIVRGHVVAQSHYTSGNVMGRAHVNPKVDNNLYQVVFKGGKVMELTTNVIAESVYNQCEANGNEYLLLDVLVDYQKDNNAISIMDQQITV